MEDLKISQSEISIFRASEDLKISQSEISIFRASEDLKHASEYGDFDAVKYLVDKGTRIDQSLINWALGHGQIKIGSYLIAKKIGRKF